MEPNKLEIAVERSVRPIVEKMGIEFVDAQIVAEPVGTVLRVLLDRTGGIDLDALTGAARAMGPVLEREVPKVAGYRLEVSSPGIERPLRKRAHFEKHLGEMARVKCSEKIGGRRNFTGTIEDVEESAVLVGMDGETVRVPLDKIAKAHLIVEF